MKKKTYAEATKDAFMQDMDYGGGDEEVDEHSETEIEDDMQPRTDDEQHREKDCLTEDA